MYNVENLHLPYYHTPRKQSLGGGNIGITLSVCPKRLIEIYETLHTCSTLPADVHEGIWLLSKI